MKGACLLLTNLCQEGHAPVNLKWISKPGYPRSERVPNLVLVRLVILSAYFIMRELPDEIARPMAEKDGRFC